MLITLTLTFGLNLILENAMILAFKADYRSHSRRRSGCSRSAGDPAARPTRGDGARADARGALYALCATRIGRAIVAVRMDRDAAALMGVNVKRIYAITFGIGAFMAGAAGGLMWVIFPISPLIARFSRQGLRDLRPGRARQRARRDGRRDRARRHRELRRASGSDRTTRRRSRSSCCCFCSCFGRPESWASGASNEELDALIAIARRLLAALAARRGQLLLRLATSMLMYARSRRPGISSAASPAIRRSRPRRSSASAPTSAASCRSRACRWSPPGAAPPGRARFRAGLGGAILHLRGHYFAIATLVIADVLREVING